MTDERKEVAASRLAEVFPLPACEGEDGEGGRRND